MIREINDGECNNSIFQTLDLGDSKFVTLVMDYPCEDLVHVKFYKDETLKHDLGEMFTFENKTYFEESEEYQKNTYKLIHMFTPKGYERRGLGQYILKWFLEISECDHIYTSDPYDLTIKDGSEITGNGINFVVKMRGLGLINNPDKFEREDYEF